MARRETLIRNTDAGLYCPAGGFHIDPWRPVARAVVTHGHADHACRGCDTYLAHHHSEPIFRARLGRSITFEAQPYREPRRIGDVSVTLFPAGHLLGSSQILVEGPGETGLERWVISGDYKLDNDPTCEPFEPVPCDVFITESTFALPIYRWQPPASVAHEINAWWRENARAGLASVLYAYALGKAQRLIAMVDHSIGPIYVHGSVTPMNHAYEQAGVDLGRWQPAGKDLGRKNGPSPAGALIIAPPSTARTPWMNRLKPYAEAQASGWMRVRGRRRRRALDRGFVLSDHADWPGLLHAIRATGAPRIGVTHGYLAPMVRWLNEQGLEAFELQTRFRGEHDETAAPDARHTTDSTHDS